MHYFSQSSIFCVHPSAAAGLRQDFVNDRNGEILLCVTLPCITVRSFAERLRGWGAIGVVSRPCKPRAGQVSGGTDATVSLASRTSPSVGLRFAVPGGRRQCLAKFGSFSAVSAPMFASRYAFCSIF